MNFLFQNLDFILPISFFTLATLAILVRVLFWDVKRESSPMLYWAGAILVASVAALGITLFYESLAAQK